MKLGKRLRLTTLLAAGAIVATMTLGAQPQTSLAQTGASAIGHYFTETGQAVGGSFWKYWNATGGINRHGYPISPEMNEKSETDGKTVVVQYFERSHFEYRPDKRIQFNVQNNNVGTALYKQKYPRGATGQTPNNTRGSVVVRATGKRIGGPFLEYFNKNSGATQFGNPLSDEFNEKSTVDGKTYKVQYFERVVLQFLPDKKAPNNVIAQAAARFRYEAKYPPKGRTGDVDGDRIVDKDDFCPKAAENINKVFDGDGCPDTMQTLLIFAAEDINNFWVETFKASGARYRVPADFLAYTKPVSTACGAAVLNNAFYCSRSHGIYYDYNFLYDQLQSDGDFAPVIILAHEWGHLVQGNLGLLGGQFYTIQTELQADCFAGAWSASAADKGLLEEGDLEEGATALYNAGDDENLPWFDEGAHGQPDQRANAYKIGYEKGVDGCLIEERNFR